MEPIAFDDGIEPIFLITEAEISDIESFTSESDTFKYHDRNSKASETKVRNDIRLGKLGEAGASKFLEQEFGIKMNYDLEIYDVANKDFSGDLGGKIHVKSCSPWRRSWTFQYGNGRDPLLDSKSSDEWLILAEVDLEESKVGIRAMLKWKDISGLLDLPMADYLKNTKRCLYWHDAKHKSIIPTVRKNGWLIK